MKKLKLTRAFLMTAIIFGGITMFAGNSYASGYYGAGNRTDTTENTNSDGGYFGAGNRSGYLGAGDRSGYAGAGNRSNNTTVTETGTDETTIGTIFSDIITIILG